MTGNWVFSAEQVLNADLASFALAGTASGEPEFEFRPGNLEFNTGLRFIGEPAIRLWWTVRYGAKFLPRMSDRVRQKIQAVYGGPHDGRSPLHRL